MFYYTSGGGGGLKFNRITEPKFNVGINNPEI